MYQMKWPLRIILIFLLVSGVCPDILIEQPPFVAAALGRDVTLPCHLKVPSGLNINVVPYWDSEPDQGNPWPASGKYENRVDLLHQGQQYVNQSLRLKHVQWEDNRRHVCKVSVTPQHEEKFRRKGSGTEVLIYEHLFFDTTGLNSSDLQCSVSVSGHPDFSLSIYFNDQILNSTSGENTTSLFVTLSQIVSRQEYQCRLSFNGTLVTSRVYQQQRSAGGSRQTEESSSSSPRVSLSGPSALAGEYPQPWVLYGGLILVQLVILLVVTIVFLKNSCS